MLCLRAVIWVRRGGYNPAKYAKNMHQEETKANWISVRVTGLGKALRMDLEEVFVNAEVKYQMRQSILWPEVSETYRKAQEGLILSA